MTIPRLSVVIPCLDEQDSLPALHSDLVTVLGGLDISYEIIFVDDGSRDATAAAIKELAALDRAVGGLLLTRNFGHQNALLAGLREARGELVLTMDADGQHPPQVIPEMLDRIGQGFEVVAGRRTGSSGEPLKYSGSKGFYRLVNLLSDVSIPEGVADFRMMTRKALDDFLAFGEHNRFSRGLVSWMGHPQALVDYGLAPRKQGRSKYSWRRMLRFAFDGITSFSSRPLRLAFSFGILFALAGLAYAVYAVIRHYSGATVEGWTSLLVTVLIIGGVQLISIGILGEYLARIFNETKRRPHYFVGSKINRPG